MEDRRRRRIAFGDLAKGMLRYRDNSDDVKMGIAELQDRLEVLVQIGAAERLSQFGKMSRHKSGNTNAEQKTRNIPKCDRWQVQSGERVKDCRMKLLKM